MQNRLGTTMFKFLKVAAEQSPVLPENNPLAGFRFVSTSDLKTCLKFPLVFIQQPGGDLSLEIPAIRPTDSIAAPMGTSRVELKLMAVSFSIRNDQSSAGQQVVVEIPYNDSLMPERNVALVAGADEDALVLVVAGVCYFEDNRQITEVGFEAVEIAGVFGKNR